MSGVEVVAVFAALGDPARLHLVERLRRPEAQSITALAADLRMTRQAVSKHLSVLEKAGIVAPHRSGREQHFALRPKALGAAERYLQAVGQAWDGALARLAAHVEGG